MFTNRFPKLVLSAALIITALVAFWAIKTSAEPDASIPAYTGRGDYQRYEIQFFQPHIGRGDYQRYESQFFPPESRAPESDSTYVGMGDLHRFEALQDIVYPGSP